MYTCMRGFIRSKYAIYMLILPIITLHVTRVIANSTSDKYTAVGVTSMRRQQLYNWFNLIG